MTQFFSSLLLAKILLVCGCLASVHRKSDALFFGCNSFGCRIAALEADVNQLKQQVARITGDNQYRTTMVPMPMNPNQGGVSPNQQNQQGQMMNQNQQNQQNQQNLQNQQNNNQQQGQQGQNQGGAQLSPENLNNVRGSNYANLGIDYPPNQQQQLRRVPNFQNNPNGQFFRAWIPRD